MPHFDLEAYLARIGAPKLSGATRETLAVLHAAHPAAIPFENLNPLLGWPVALDAESIQNKLVHGGRGGWCFEQNALFQMALESYGFKVTTLGARVVWNAPQEAPLGARSHMLLKVEAADGVYLADVGFGGGTLTGPLEWRTDAAQQTPHERFRLTALDGATLLQEIEINGEWKPLYRFTEEPQLPADYAVSNWFLCTHESSFFRHTLTCARATPERKYALRNNELSIYSKGAIEKRTLSTADELQACLANEIGIRLPEGTREQAELHTALSRIIDNAAAVR